MIGSEIKTMTETILDDTVDDVLFYQLVNVSKNRIEGLRSWMMLRALDSSKTSTTGNAYQTAITLPTAWQRTYKLMVGQDNLYTQIPFDEQHSHRYSPNKYLVDVANNSYYLMGSLGQAETIYNYYIKKTDDIIATTAPVWDDRFHSIIAYEVAAYIMGGVDADDIFARMSPVNASIAASILDGMEKWDADMQLTAQGNALQVDYAVGGVELGLL